MFLVVVEGPDNSGKTTLVKELQARLTSLAVDKLGAADEVRAVREPGSTTAGEMIRLTLKETMRPGIIPLPDTAALCLFFAARFALLDELERNPADIVLLDRYWPSSVVYNANDKRATQLCNRLVDSLPPRRLGDYFVFLLPPHETYKRRAQERPVADSQDMLSEEAYGALCNRYRSVVRDIVLTSTSPVAVYDKPGDLDDADINGLVCDIAMRSVIPPQRQEAAA